MKPAGDNDVPKADWADQLRYLNVQFTHSLCVNHNLIASASVFFHRLCSMSNNNY